MLTWLSNNLLTIVIILVLAAIVGLAIRSMIKNRHKPGGGCGGSCGSCPYSGSCHSKS